MYTIEFRKIAIKIDISPNSLDILLKYLGGLHNHLWKQVMFFKPESIEGLCIGTILEENRPEEREIKWIEVEGAT